MWLNWNASCIAPKFCRLSPLFLSTSNTGVVVHHADQEERLMRGRLQQSNHRSPRCPRLLQCRLSRFAASRSSQDNSQLHPRISIQLLKGDIESGEWPEHRSNLEAIIKYYEEGGRCPQDVDTCDGQFEFQNTQIYILYSPLPPTLCFKTAKLL